MTKVGDDGIQVVRDVREEISAEYANDPGRLVDHYVAEQERYKDRLVRPVAPNEIDRMRERRAFLEAAELGPLEAE